MFKYVIEKTVINRMLQFVDNMLPVQRMNATRVKQKCICSGKLEACITAAGDHWHYSRVRLISKQWVNIQEASG